MLPISRSPQSSRVGVPGDMITALALSPDGKQLAWGTVGGTKVSLRLVDVDDDQLGFHCDQPGHYKGRSIVSGAVRSLAFRSDGQGLVMMTTDGYLLAWPLSFDGWRNPEIFFLGDHTSSGVASFDSGNRFAVGFADGSVALLEMIGSLSHG